MRGPRLLWGLLAITVVSVIAAVAIPPGAYASRISFAPRLGAYDGLSVAVDVDGREVTVHAPEGFYIARTAESDPPPRAEMRIASTGGYSGFLVSIKAGPGPRPGRQIGERDGRPIYAIRQGRGASWEVVPGATLTVQTRDSSQAQLLALIDAIET